MFHLLIPLVPLAIAGALFLKRKSLAYGCPIILTLLKMLLTQISFIFLFTGLSLFLTVFLTRRLKEFLGESLIAVAAYAFIGVAIFELVSNFGVWLVGGCLSSEGSLYSLSFASLLECYREAFFYSASHFLRDVPLTVLVVKAGSFVGKILTLKEPISKQVTI